MVHIRKHPITGEDLSGRNYCFTTRAYEMMSPEEIEMSRQREWEYHDRKFLDDLRRLDGLGVLKSEISYGQPESLVA